MRGFRRTAMQSEYDIGLTRVIFREERARMSQRLLHEKNTDKGEKTDMKMFAKKLTALLLIGILTMSLTACRKSYTKGEVDGNTYTNKWAEVQVTLPSGYKMLDVSDLNYSGSMSKFDIGCAFKADDKTAPICYVLTLEGEQDLAAIGQEFADEFGGTGGAMNVKQGKTTYQVSINKLNYSIADASYDVYHISVGTGDLYCALHDVEGTGVIVIYVITLSGGTTEDEVFDMFTKM